MNKKAADFWQEFCTTTGIDASTNYQVWYFGDNAEMADELAKLVIKGKKTATASLAKTNEVLPDDAPVADGLSVVTDFHGEPMCVVQTVEIRHIPFIEVDAEFAFDEGEGDQSLEYWRTVHRDYYKRETERLGIAFDERDLVCCERFRLLYSK